MDWYENPNIIAALSGFLIAAVPAGLTARYAWRGKIAELSIGQTEKALMNLFSAHDNFIKELRSELADKAQQIRDLQSSRAQLYKEIDELHALRQSERRIYQEQIINMENKVDEALDKLSLSERKTRDCEARCSELALRVENLEKRISRKPPPPS
jgi:septal ring factor EnvC (AmiA/AmiB activator)